MCKQPVCNPAIADSKIKDVAFLLHSNYSKVFCLIVNVIASVMVAVCQLLILDPCLKTNEMKDSFLAISIAKNNESPGNKTVK